MPEAIRLALLQLGASGPMMYRDQILAEQRVLPSVGSLPRVIRSIVLKEQRHD